MVLELFLESGIFEHQIANQQYVPRTKLYYNTMYLLNFLPAVGFLVLEVVLGLKNTSFLAEVVVFGIFSLCCYYYKQLP